MEEIFKNHFWVIRVLGVAVATGLAASAIMTQVGTAVALDVRAGDDDDKKGKDDEEDEDATKKKGLNFGDNPFGRAGRRVSSTMLAAKNKTADDIKARNVFCPTCIPVVETTGTMPLDADGQPIGIQPGEVKSMLPLELMATMEATDPELSLATVRDTENQVTGLYGRGDTLRPSVIVVGVDAGLLHIRNNARLEYVQLGEDRTAPTTRAPAKTDGKPPPPKKKNPREIDGAAEAINCPDENTCIVDRSFVEKLMGNPAMLAKQARIVPSQRDGEVQGFKFYGIRRGSLPKLLGLKNGDMLTEVNGEEVKSVDQAMSLAMKLRRASNLSVSLVRKGKTINKEIQIQ